MENKKDILRREKSMNILDAILKEANGATAYEGLEIVASPISFFLIGIADMTGRKRRQIMEIFFEMVRKGADYQRETMK